LLSAGFDTSRCPKDGNNFAPRLGFSYGFNENRCARRLRPLLRAHADHRSRHSAFTERHQRHGHQFARRCHRRRRTRLSEHTDHAAARANPNLYLFTDNYVQPYVQQARLGFEREILPNLSLSATYLLYRGVHLTRTRDANLFAPVQTIVATPDGQSATFCAFRRRARLHATTALAF
jgi:hypothetical protein